MKQEVKRRNSETGEVRLRNMELLPVLLSFVMESAWFPSSLEFSSFWESVINRLRSNGEETDWDEPHVAQYPPRNWPGRGVLGTVAIWVRPGSGWLHYVHLQQFGTQLENDQGLTAQKDPAFGVRVQYTSSHVLKICII